MSSKLTTHDLLRILSRSADETRLSMYCFNASKCLYREKSHTLYRLPNYLMRYLAEMHQKVKEKIYIHNKITSLLDLWKVKSIDFLNQEISLDMHGQLQRTP